jgi:hypothetical protein
MRLTVAAEGTLLGRIAILSIENVKPSLAYKIHIPVELQAEAATLSINLLHPEVRSWRGLLGRYYLFNESTARYGKSDRQTFILDDVFGDLRTQTSSYDTLISRVQFGGEADGRLDVEIEGTAQLHRVIVPFTVSAKVQVQGIMLESKFKDFSAKLLDLEHYQPLQMSDGMGKYEPRF